VESEELRGEHLVGLDRCVQVGSPTKLIRVGSIPTFGTTSPLHDPHAHDVALRQVMLSNEAAVSVERACP
jgi:hypothetical protein